MKIADKFILILAMFLLLFVLSYISTHDFVAGLIISFLLTVTITYSSIHLFKRYTKLKKIPISKMEDGLAFMGIKEQSDLISSSLPECFEIINKDFYFDITVNCEKIAVFPNYKFGPCSKDDIAKFFKTCQAEEITKCAVLSRQNTREILLFAENLPLEFKFIPSKSIRAFLVKHNLVDKIAIPKKNRNGKKQNPKEFLRSLPKTVLSRGQAKYYLISGISLVVMSIFTPFKTYYVIFSVITLSLAIICLLKTAF